MYLISLFYLSYFERAPAVLNGLNNLNLLDMISVITLNSLNLKGMGSKNEAGTMEEEVNELTEWRRNDTKNF